MDFLNAIGLDAGTLEGVIKIAASMVVGALVGWERERVHQAAGLRTHMLVCMGACLIMAASIWYVDVTGKGDTLRMGAQVISGIGFLGAGTIIKGDNGIKGLTTAASLWVVACIGLAIGAGFYWGAILTAMLTYAALVFVKSLEARAARDVVRLEMCALDDGKVAGAVMETLLRENVSITDFSTHRLAGKLVMTVRVSFPKGTRPSSHLVERLTDIEGMESVRNR